MKKTIICIMLLFAFILGGCDKKIDLEENESGFYDDKNNIQYVPCAQFAVKPLKVGAEYATDGDLTYYQIAWEKPTRFICDNDNGVSFVYRASTIDDITIKNFNPIAAQVYLEGDKSVIVATYYCAQDYLPDELKGENMQDDSALINSIRDSLIKDESVNLASTDISEKDRYYLRLLSADYPGLYYSVVFLSDNKGEYYLNDRGSGKYVLAKDDIVKRVIG